jgi:nucleoside-diphosphate-sugar epimerase
MTRAPSIEKAKKILRYQPKISLEEGIRRIIKKKIEESRQ